LAPRFVTEVLMRQVIRHHWVLIACLVIACLVQACLLAPCHGQASSQAIQVLDSDAEALAARLSLIDSAQHSIEMSTFHIESGKSTNVILAALRSAAERGVRVRLLLDGLNMNLSADEVKGLQKAGVEIFEFHPVGSGGLRKLNRRSHSKLLVIDEKLLMLGSRNLRDKHFGLAGDRYIDFELVLQGDMAAKAACYFDWLWNSCHVGRAKGKKKAVDLCDGCQNRSIACGPVRFNFEPQFDVPVSCLYDGTIDKAAKRMRAQRIEWVNSARTSLIIETPYPAFSIASLRAIESAARRGVRVQIFTNSNASNDKSITWAALQNVRRRLLKLGIEIYEYQGKDTMHAKMFLVDGKFAVLGSHNFDARSDNYNLEFCIKVDSAEFTRELENRFECRRMQSSRVTLAKPTRNQRLVQRTKTRLRQLSALVLRPLL
jgi:putative cardiolipin synthase